jgi:uncharacterized protein
MLGMEITVTDEPGAHRYVITADGEYAGEIVYEFRNGHRALPHTGVEPAFEGKGVAGEAVRQVLDRSRALGELVVPQCPYIAVWIERHPDYADLVAR